MIFKFLLSALILVVLQVSAETINSASVPVSLLGLSKKLARDDRCEENGFTCIDCEHSLYCFQLPNGDWVTDETKCKSDETCLLATGECSSDFNPDCNSGFLNYKFTCHQVGVFPHVFDCFKYHVCIANNDGNIIVDSNDYSCRDGFAFDPSTSLCSKKHQGRCEPIVESCTRIGQSGPILGSSHHFFACLNTLIDGEQVLLPHVFYCNNDEQFINNECRDPTPPSGLDEDGKCDADGDFYDADDCKRFNTCVSGNNPVSKNCDPNNYYDGWEKTCKPFECS